MNCETGQEVAIKLALEQKLHNSAELREVVLQACLQHDCIVPILDILYDPVKPTSKSFLRSASNVAISCARFPTPRPADLQRSDYLTGACHKQEIPRPS